jgi:hypothetical protein
VEEKANRPARVTSHVRVRVSVLRLLQVVGLLLTHNAHTSFKNAYGNTALSLASSQRAQAWIKRVTEGGAAERTKLAGELAAADTEAESKVSERRAKEDAEWVVG